MRSEDFTVKLMSLSALLNHYLQEAVLAQKGRALLWVPLGLGLGVVIYFAFPYEPKLSLLLMPVLLMFSFWRFGLRRQAGQYLRPVFMLGMIIMIGLLAAKLRTEAVSEPVLSSNRSTYFIEAVIVDVVTTQADAPRLLVAPIRMSNLTAKQTPLRLRIGLRPQTVENMNLAPGQVIRGVAILNPPAGPAYPQGYDYARKAYFRAIGGVGFMPGNPNLAPATKMNLRLEFLTWLNHLRWQLTKKIVKKIEDRAEGSQVIAGFGAAMVTGHQAYLNDSFVTAMRNSGLAHILSISGVHMAIVGGFLFYTLRAILALSGRLTLNLPIKKIAAALSMSGIGVYLAISGAPAPAVRAAIVGWVAFGAILLDRQAMSLRALSFAAIIIILLTPEAVLEPGFQMSFAATAALLALGEASKAQIPTLSLPAWLKTLQGLKNAARLTFLSSLVASLSTTPFGLAYFNRVPVYGLFANLFEAPITTFVIMPSLAIGTISLSTPIGDWALSCSHFGLEIIAHIADFTSALPYAVIGHASGNPLGVGLAAFGVFWVCLCKGWCRWLGLIAATAVLWGGSPSKPDYWVDPYGSNAAFVADDKAYPLRDKVKQYGFEVWRQHLNIDRQALETDNQFYRCQSYACVPLNNNNAHSIGFWFGIKPPKTEVLEDLCVHSSLVIVRSQIDHWPGRCSQTSRLSKIDLEKLGALELTRIDLNPKMAWRIRSSQVFRGVRPWSVVATNEDAMPLSQ